jgi:hypothetical protein
MENNAFARVGCSPSLFSRGVVLSFSASVLFSSCSCPVLSCPALPCPAQLGITAQ